MTPWPRDGQERALGDPTRAKGDRAGLSSHAPYEIQAAKADLSLVSSALSSKATVAENPDPPPISTSSTSCLWTTLRVLLRLAQHF